MKNKWIIPVVLFIILVTVYVARGLFQSRVELEVLQVGKIEEVTSTQGVLIKNEIVNSVTLSGATEVYARDGERVANNEIIAMLYGNTEDEALFSELAEINKKINAISESEADSSVYISDTMQMESELSDCVDEIIREGAVNDYSRLSVHRYKLSLITSLKAMVRGEDVVTPAEEMITLQTRKNEIEAKLGGSSHILSAEMSGIYYEGKDGFEEKLVPEKIDSITPAAVNDVIEGNKNGNILNDESIYTYKIVDNFSYYVAVNLDKETSKNIKAGDGVIVRFTNFSNSDNSATVTYVSEPNSDGVRTVVAKCDNYVDGLLSHRVVNVDFVKKSVSGYKVSVEHIHTVDNKVGLYIKRGAVMKFLPINIEYSNEEEAIVSSLDPTMPIKSYDEIVVSAPEFKDGKVIE